MLHSGHSQRFTSSGGILPIERYNDSILVLNPLEDRVPYLRTLCQLFQSLTPPFPCNPSTMTLGSDSPFPRNVGGLHGFNNSDIFPPGIPNVPSDVAQNTSSSNGLNAYLNALRRV